MAEQGKHTPGPWDWFKYSDGRVYLATPHRGRLIVMDFVRFGMQYAQPRFATWKGDERENMGGIMVEAAKLPGAVKGHPDARLIAAAPCLLAACQLLDLIESNGVTHVIDIMPAVEAARAAIRKAEGSAAEGGAP